MSTLSVIIVTWQSAEVITICLESLYRHTDPATTDVLILDNGSTDPTVALASAAAENPGRAHTTTIITNPRNLYFAKAVNQGLARATGEYIAILNPDTITQPDTWQRLQAFHQAHPDAGLLGPQLRNSANQIVPSAREFPTFLTLLYEVTGLRYFFRGSARYDHWRMGYFSHDQTRPVDQPMGACLLTSRKAIDCIGPLDERFSMFFNDVDWCRRFSNAGMTNFYVSEAHLIHHGGHSIRQRRLAMIWLSHWGFLRFLAKYARGGWGNPAVWCASGLLFILGLLRSGLILGRLPRQWIQHHA